jgi:hypothetical protein
MRRQLEASGSSDEYDDNTLAEMVTSGILFSGYLGVLLYTIRTCVLRCAVVRPTEHQAWFNRTDKLITAAIVCALLARCLYFSDSFVMLLRGTHYIPLPLYPALSILAFVSSDSAVAMLCRLWLSYADRARDSSMNLLLKNCLLAMLLLQPMLLFALLALLYFGYLTAILSTLTAACLLCALAVIASGLSFTHSLQDYQEGELLKRVSMTVKTIAGSCCLRVGFYTARLYWKDSLQKLRRAEDQTEYQVNIYYSMTLMSLIFLVELLPLTLCSLSLGQVYKTALTCTPSPRLIMQNLRTLFCLDDRAPPRPLFHSVQGITPNNRRESLLETESEGSDHHQMT